MTYGTFDPTRKSSGFAKKKYFNVKEGTQLYRVLPPYGDLASKGQLAVYWSLFWLRGSDGRNRPVVSIRRLDRNKNVVVADPIFDKIEALKVSLSYMEKNQENPMIIEKMKATIQDLNVDKAYYLNAMNPQGEIGILKVRYTAFQALQKRMEELYKEGVDAVNVGPGKGVFFEFKRYKDEKGKTIYEVVPATKKTRTPEGKLISEYLEAPIDENVMARVKNEGADLSTLYKARTSEEMTALATLDPLMVDRVFARPVDTDEDPEMTADDIAENNLVIPANHNTGLGADKAPGTQSFAGYNQPVGMTQAPAAALQNATPVGQTSGYLTQPSVSTTNAGPLTHDQIQNILFGAGQK